ncbi:hypothetical protein [Viscerimonas tarda]
MRTTISQSNKQIVGNNWANITSPNAQSYTVDDIINANEEGCNDGLAAYLKKMRKELKANLQNALPIMESFFNSINLEKENCKLMLLRLADINRFDFIIAIDKAVYFNDELCRPIYEKSFDVRRQNSNFDISFMPFNGSLNIESLNSDNFIAIYGKPE